MFELLWAGQLLKTNELSGTLPHRKALSHEIRHQPGCMHGRRMHIPPLLPLLKLLLNYQLNFYLKCGRAQSFQVNIILGAQEP